MHHEQFFEYVNLGASIGGGFTNTAEIHTMKYQEANNGLDGELWWAKVC